MTQESMNAVRIFVTRTVVVERKCASTVTRKKQRRRQARWSCSHDDAVVQFPYSPSRVWLPTLTLSSSAFDQPVESEQQNCPNDCQNQAHQKSGAAQISSVIDRTSISE